MESMRLVSVRVENVRGLELAEVRVGDGLTVIGGGNHQGKSSFLDGICYALGGKKLFPPDPIKEGEDEAEIELRLGGGTEILPWPCTVHRTIRRSDNGDCTTRVTITSEEGDEAPTPQTLLNSLIGSGLGFDPLGFVGMSAKEQVNCLRQLVGLDFEELDGKRQTLYEERTKVNREAKQLDGKLKQTPIHTDVPSERVSVLALMTQLREAERHNKTIEIHTRDLDAMARRMTEISNKIVELQEQQAELTKRFEAKASVKGMELIDVDPIQQAIEQSEATNHKIDENEERLELYGAKKSLEKQSRLLTSTIEDIDKQKVKLASDATWPIEGLGFGSDGIAYNGVAFSQLSSSEQLEVAVAISLGLSPHFPFAIVRDGSLLDEERLAEMAGIVDRYGGQVLLERVSKGPECHVIIEDGRRVR